MTPGVSAVPQLSHLALPPALAALCSAFFRAATPFTAHWVYVSCDQTLYGTKAEQNQA